MATQKIIDTFGLDYNYFCLYVSSNGISKPSQKNFIDINKKYNSKRYYYINNSLEEELIDNTIDNIKKFPNTLNKLINPFINNDNNIDNSSNILSILQSNLLKHFNNLIINDNILNCYSNDDKKYRVLVLDNWNNDHINNKTFINFINITNKTIITNGNKELYLCIFITKNFDTDIDQLFIAENDKYFYNRYYYVHNFNINLLIGNITHLVRTYPFKYSQYLKSFC